MHHYLAAFLFEFVIDRDERSYNFVSPVHAVLYHLVGNFGILRKTRTVKICCDNILLAVTFSLRL